MRFAESPITIAATSILVSFPAAFPTAFPVASLAAFFAAFSAIFFATPLVTAPPITRICIKFPSDSTGAEISAAMDAASAARAGSTPSSTRSS